MSVFKSVVTSLSLIGITLLIAILMAFLFCRKRIVKRKLTPCCCKGWHKGPQVIDIYTLVSSGPSDDNDLKNKCQNCYEPDIAHNPSSADEAV